MSSPRATHFVLPYDVLVQVADILFNDIRNYFVIKEHMLRYTLVNRQFAEVFHHRCFHKTVIGDSARLSNTSSRFRKMLDVLTGNPVLATYVKHLTLIMHNPGNNSLLPLLLNRFTSLLSLTLRSTGPSEIDGVRPSWTSFTVDFRMSVTHICTSPSLERLEVSEIDSVPASLFVAQSHLTRIAFLRCAPLFNSDSIPQAVVSVARSSALPLSCSMAGMDFSRGDTALGVVRSSPQFFSRIRVLKVHTSWKQEHYRALYASILHLAGISPLVNFEIIVDKLGKREKADMPPKDWLSPLSAFKNVETLKLTYIATGWLHELFHFRESIPCFLLSLDGSKLETLVIAFVGLDDDGVWHATRQCFWQEVEGFLIEGVAQGRLRRLREVVVEIGLDKTEYSPALRKARQWTEECTILSKLQVDRKHVLLKSKLGADILLSHRMLETWFTPKWELEVYRTRLRAARANGYIVVAGRASDRHCWLEPRITGGAGKV
ncbi:hypothetical protein NMY22_g15480 [Coprinellus aureogranulatus]|nr:hypothetical protein NMY22_g15480 [Coprinellus aureogranulatus]